MPRYSVHDTHHTIYLRLKDSSAVGIGPISSVWGCWFGCVGLIVRTPDELGHLTAKFDPKNDRYSLTPGMPTTAQWKKLTQPSDIKRADRTVLGYNGQLDVIVGNRALTLDDPLRRIVETYVTPVTWAVGQVRPRKNETSYPCIVALKGSDVYAVCGPLHTGAHRASNPDAPEYFWRDVEEVAL